MLSTLGLVGVLGSRGGWWALLAFGLVGCTLRGAPQRPAPVGDTCLGRFTFTRPQALHLARSEYALYGTTLSAQPLAGRAPADVWRQHLRELAARPDLAGAVFHRFRLDTGLRGVWYRQHPDDRLTVMLEAMQTHDDVAVFLARSFGEDKLAVAQKLVNQVSALFSADRTTGFCVGPGAFHTRSLTENARVELAHPGAPSLRLRLTSQLVDRPDHTGEDLDEVREFARASGSTLTVLRERRRAVAGLDGSEAWVTLRPPGEPMLAKFVWAFGGTDRQGAPNLRVIGDADEADRPALEAVWDALLDTLAPLPAGVKAEARPDTVVLPDDET